MSELKEFPYEEIRNGPDGDRFDTAQAALDYLLEQHREKGDPEAPLPTMDNVWLIRHSDGSELRVWKNEDGEFEGEEVDSECFEAPGGIVNVSGFCGTAEKRQSPDEMYQDTWEMPRTQEELLDLDFEDDMAALEAFYEEQQQASNDDEGGGFKP